MATAQLPGGVNCRTVSGSMNVGPLLTTWTDCITIPEFVPSPGIAGTDASTIGNSFLVDAFAQLQGIIPANGDEHPVYAGAFCSNIRIDPKAGNQGPSPVGLTVMVDWMGPTNIQGTFQSGSGTVTNPTNHALAVMPYQIQEIRNFDKDGKATAVWLQIGQINPTAPGYGPYRIADIRVMRTMHHVRISQYEDITGDNPYVLTGSNYVAAQPFYNTDTWYGFPPNWLLFLGATVDDNGLNIARIDYSFMVNNRGWNKFIAVSVQQNGYVVKELNNLPVSVLLAETAAPLNDGSTNGAPAPPGWNKANVIDGVPINGVGIFDMLQSTAFADAFPKIYTQIGL